MPRQGYGAAHEAHRRRLKPMVDAGMASCARCGAMILPGQLWELDHAAGKQGYLGPSHRRCNRSAGGREGAAITNGKNKLRKAGRMRWSREW